MIRGTDDIQERQKTNQGREDSQPKARGQNEEIVTREIGWRINVAKKGPTERKNGKRIRWGDIACPECGSMSRQMTESENGKNL